MPKWVRVALAVVATLVIAGVIIWNFAFGNSFKSLTPLRGLVGSEKAPLLASDAVKAEFRKLGYDLQVDTAGSRAMLTADPKAYDFFFPGSGPLATELTDKTPGAKTYAPFYSPLVVLTFKPIKQLMVTSGIAQEANGATTFRVDKYLELTQKGTRWSDLPNNTAYPASKSVLVSTTNPKSSNSALMFASLAAYVSNGNRVVTTDAEIDKVIAPISKVFVDQGYTESSSEAPFQDYLALGMSKTPMLLAYESQLLARKVAKDAAVTDDMVTMYPGPGLVSKHTVVALTSNGNAFGDAFMTNANLTQAAAKFGFRPTNASAFNEALKQAGVAQPPTLADVVDPSPYAILERLAGKL